MPDDIDTLISEINTAGAEREEVVKAPDRIAEAIEKQE